MLLKNENIVCISDCDWQNVYMNSAIELLSETAKNNNVLYIDRQHTIKYVISSFFKCKNSIQKYRIFGFQKRIRNVETRNGAQLNVLTPYPSFPSNWVNNDGKIYRLILRFNAFLLNKNFKKAIKQLKFTQPILINSWNPFVGIFLNNEINKKLEVYFCWDEMRLAPYYKPHVGVIEDEYVKKVDAVISTSKTLAENRSSLSKNNFVIENGADFKLFNKAYKIKSKLTRKQKTIGYIGSIDYRFDIDLVKYLVRNSPEFNYIIVGRNENSEAVNILSKFSNVKIYGPQIPEKLPEFAAQMDVGIIPFCRLEVIRSMYPIKIHEYLAAGLAVVMTNFADFSELDDMIFSTNKPEIFLDRIRKEIKTDSENKQLKRINFAKNNSWEKRVGKLNKILYDLLKEKEQEQQKSL
ncbi:MAG: glycosyltransferase [Bacteroidales bacterium]|nr:glycosyltransferase [Bacteroidales bacterium]